MDSWTKCQDKLPTVVEALARFLGLLASSIPWPVALCSTVTLSAAQKMQKCFLSWYNPFENSPEDSHSLAICMVAPKICKRCWRCHNPGHVILTLEWSVGFSFFGVLMPFLARVYQGVVSSHPCFWKHPVANAQGMLPVRFCGWQDLARSAFFASAAIPLRTKYDCRLIDIAIGFVILMLIKLFPRNSLSFKCILYKYLFHSL